MDEQLAAIYGTAQPDEQDLEKTAAAELLVKLAEDEGVDLNSFSDEEIGSMVNDLYGAEGSEEGEEGEAEGEAEGEDAGEETGEGEAEEKVAEADYLGRVMAHSMTQELRNIEKEAAAKEVSYKGHKPTAGKLTRTLGGMSLGGLAGAAGGGATGAGLGALAALASRGKISPGAAAKAGGLAGYTAGGIGGQVVGGVKGYRKAKAVEKTLETLKKKSSVDLEQLAQQRAFELAKEAGYVDDQGQPIQKEASLEQTVEQRALEICEAAGLPVEWNE